jgi:hypothetical protein
MPAKLGTWDTYFYFPSEGRACFEDFYHTGKNPNGFGRD